MPDIKETLIDLLTGYSLDTYEDVQYVADELIAKGVLPVVRCKDCIHWYDREGVCLKIYSDGAVSPYAWQDRNPDDYCSYGERKDGDG